MEGKDTVMSKIKINCKAPKGKWTQVKVNKRQQSNTGKNAKRIQMTQSSKVDQRGSSGSGRPAMKEKYLHCLLKKKNKIMYRTTI